jgi:succinate dehydrogenase/fumarate reductase flavoprotein subunit
MSRACGNSPEDWDVFDVITFLQNQFVPSLKAKDLHELRLVHETKNMLLNAEMKLKASLFRTESRGSHYIEDL